MAKVTRNKKNKDGTFQQETVLSQKFSIAGSINLEKEDILNFDLDKRNEDYDYLDPHWQTLYDSFIGGGSIENADDDVYLIKKGNEPDKKYQQRKRCSVYYNKPAQIITTFQSYIWRKEPERVLPESLNQYIENVDRNDKSVNKFFSYITKMSQVFGIYYVYVDFPVNPQASELNKQSVSDENKLNLRPYFCPIDPRDLLDWGFASMPDGSKKLSYVVIKENVKTFDAPFMKTEKRDQYRIIFPTKQQVYINVKTADNKNTIQLIEETINTLGEIPLVPFYSEEIKFGIGKSTIHDITPLALELYNKHSDRQHAETMSAFPMLFMKGFDREGGLTVSEDMAIKTENENSDVRYVEFSGKSIEALRESEKEIVNEIFDIAMKQVRPRSSSRETAEAKRLDRLDALSEIQSRALGFSNSEQRCWEFAAKWLNEDPGKVKISYNLDFNVAQIAADLVKVLLDMRVSNDISRKTLWKILEQGEVMPRNFDPEQEKIEIEEESANEFTQQTQQNQSEEDLLLQQQNQIEE